MPSLANTQELDAVLRNGVDSGAVPGVVAIVSDHRDVRYLTAVGVRDVDSAAPMRDDTVFRIASMTKIVTAIAVLQLAERGVLSLDQPVGDILPAFDRLQVLDGFDGDRPRLRAPARRATVAELISHRAGFAYDTWNERLLRYHALTGVPNIGSGSRRAFTIPLAWDPGTRFDYGIGMDWAGLLVEELSGERFDRYLARHVFEPLAMEDTTMTPTAAQRARAAVVHVRGANGGWVTDAADNAQDPEFFAGGHGLYSTAPDFARLQRALLQDGHGAAGVLREASIRRMFADQLHGLPVHSLRSVLPAFSADVELGAGVTSGFGVFVTTVRRNGLRDIGSGGWAGVYNTSFWVDRRQRLGAALYAQTLPFFDPGFVALLQRFEAAVYAVFA